MAYNGATAASSVANPPIRIAGGMGGVSQQSTASGGGRGVWFYNSSNGSTELQGANFFTDAKALGMQAGDLLLFVVATGSSIACGMGVIGTVSTSGAAIASTGASLTSTFT